MGEKTFPNVNSHIEGRKTSFFLYASVCHSEYSFGFVVEPIFGKLLLRALVLFLDGW